MLQADESGAPKRGTELLRIDMQRMNICFHLVAAWIDRGPVSRDGISTAQPRANDACAFRMPIKWMADSSSTRIAWRQAANVALRTERRISSLFFSFV